MIRTFVRTFTQDLKVSKGVWGDLTNRSESLNIQKPNKIVPPTNNKAYHAPPLINETFQQAYELLQEESGEIYEKIKNETDPIVKDKLLNKAELYNPEVLYNLQNSPENLDLSQPVYRNFAEKQWRSHDLMVLMQRLEQFKVIPDTMPTLDPKVEVKVRFPHNTKPELNNWITPGDFLPAFAVAQPPVIKIQSFESSDVTKVKKYTVLIVNPDDPDLTKNSYKTTLNFGVSNLLLTLKDNTLDIEKYLSDNLSIFKPYEPLLPEINTGKYQRACVWVFEQENNQDIQINSDFDIENFDIRNFAAANNLNAVGAFVWRQVFDRSVNATRSAYGKPPGRVFHRVRKSEPYRG